VQQAEVQQAEVQQAEVLNEARSRDGQLGARLVKDTRHCFWIGVSEAAGESDDSAKSAATNLVATDRLAALGAVAGFQTRHCGGRSNAKLQPGMA
jgi:hypothetical protein